MATPAPANDPERAPLLPTRDDDAPEPAARRKPFWRRRACGYCVLGYFVLDALIGLVVVFFLRDKLSSHDLTYPGESLRWKPCGAAEGRPLECSSVETPMDHFNATRSANLTFTIPLIRLRGNDNATHNILVNPGGPGGSGVQFVQRGGVDLQKSVGRDFHIVGFDPRGIGASLPAAECFGDASQRRKNGMRFNGDIEHDSDLYDETANLVRACAEHVGRYAPHVNTPQTAADMNSILDALGQDNLYYVGYSYGTCLGATYANLFPDRSERVVIDGVLNNFIWYNDLAFTPFYQDTDRVADGFFDECHKAGSDCPLSSFGDSGKAIRRNVTSFLEHLRDDGPMNVYVNSTLFGQVSYGSVMFKGIFQSLYSPNRWYTAADTLAQLLSGNGTAALLAWPDQHIPEADGEDNQGETDIFVTANDSPSGPGVWPSDRRSVLDIAIPSAEKYAPWTHTTLDTLIVLSHWPVPKAHDFKPRVGVETLHPVLVMSTTYDPVCPLASAKQTRDSFVGSKLIEVAGYGHCSIARPSKCANRLLRAYFVNGTMPEENHTICQADEPYFVNPEKDETVAASVAEDELMAALRGLSDSISPLIL